MDDQAQLRYSRHLLLPEWSEDVQQRLSRAHALVVGAGGLGSPALMYLVAAGVGHITVVDPDQVDLTNLQRQIAHTTARVGQDKVASARDTMAALNPDVQIDAVAREADEPWLRSVLPDCDVVLDCTDRFATRQLINRASRAAGVPLVSASAVGFDGQISAFDPRDPASPCYACLFPPSVMPAETPCALMGVFAPVVGMLGVMQAGVALQLLAQLPGHRSLVGRLQMLDGREWRWTELRVARQPACPVCGPA